jgi:hypothetical protein
LTADELRRVISLASVLVDSAASSGRARRCAERKAIDATMERSNSTSSTVKTPGSHRRRGHNYVITTIMDPLHHNNRKNVDDYLLKVDRILQLCDQMRAKYASHICDVAVADEVIGRVPALRQAALSLKNSANNLCIAFADSKSLAPNQGRTIEGHHSTRQEIEEIWKLFMALNDCRASIRDANKLTNEMIVGDSRRRSMNDYLMYVSRRVRRPASTDYESLYKQIANECANAIRKYEDEAHALAYATPEYKLAARDVEQTWDALRSLYAHMLNALNRILRAEDWIESALRNTRLLESRISKQYDSIALSDSDGALIAMWGNPTDDRLVCARKAEIAANRIARDLFNDCEDISIHQLNGRSDRWRRCDLRAGNRHIDVKNTRENEAGGGTVDVVVRKFKKESRKDVHIWSFVTTMDFDREIRWLGETSAATIQALVNEFSSPRLDVQDMVHIVGGDRGDRSPAIPSWVFDYPDVAYAERRILLDAITNSCEYWPIDTHLQVPLICASRRFNCNQAALRAVCAGSTDEMHVEACALQNRVRAPGTISRPLLFLHCIDRFLFHSASGGAFPEATLRRLLFIDAGRDRGSLRWPALVLDPLAEVSSILYALGVLSQAIGRSGDRPSAMRLKRNGILRGRLGKSDKWITMVAYCGNPRGCAERPLIFGREETCRICSYLKCRRCRYCSFGCTTILSVNSAHTN